LKAGVRISKYLTESGYQTAFLFMLDGLANVIDFGFHFWMGRKLSPAEFAILQTLNSVVLIYTTASGVFQPVVGRFVAEARVTGHGGSISAIFRSFLGAALWLGSGLTLLVLLLSNQLAQWLNIPAWGIQFCGLLIFLSTLRPVAVGVLQGQERFIFFGFTRVLTSLGRLVLGILLVYAGLSLRGAVIAFPFGWLVGVVGAFLFLGRSIWAKGERPHDDILRRGWELSFHALLAYIAFMSLTSLDLIWVNRFLPVDLAGAYASMVLLRRVIALLPGVAVIVMFPRIAATLAQGLLPDRLLMGTAGIILGASGVLTLIYFVFGKQLILYIFGSAYLPASSLLGWMGFAMMGISLSSIWLNYYLAEKPVIFVIFLCMAVALEWVLLTVSSASMQNAIRSLSYTGWLLTIAGLLLYLFKSRPALVAAR
jgi:O-antigen/teichoic acid export membrane protein